MLRDYLTAALHKAHYEILADDGSFYGEIPGLEGVYANAPTLEDCRDGLRKSLRNGFSSGSPRTCHCLR